MVKVFLDFTKLLPIPANKLQEINDEFNVVLNMYMIMVKMNI